MVNWRKMRCRQGQASRTKRFKFVKLNIYCFYTFKNIRECRRGNASKAIDRCNTAIVLRDLKQVENQSRNHALRKKNSSIHAWERKCICFVGIPQLHALVWCDQFLWTQQKPKDVIHNRDTLWFDTFHYNSDVYEINPLALCATINKNTKYGSIVAE